MFCIGVQCGKSSNVNARNKAWTKALGFQNSKARTNFDWVFETGGKKHNQYDFYYLQTRSAAKDI